MTLHEQRFSVILLFSVENSGVCLNVRLQRGLAWILAYCLSAAGTPCGIHSIRGASSFDRSRPHRVQQTDSLSIRQKPLAALFCTFPQLRTATATWHNARHATATEIQLQMVLVWMGEAEKLSDCSCTVDQLAFTFAVLSSRRCFRAARWLVRSW